MITHCTFRENISHILSYEGADIIMLHHRTINGHAPQSSLHLGCETCCQSSTAG